MRGLGAEARSALRGAELPCPTWWSRQEENGGGKDERGRRSGGKSLPGPIVVLTVLHKLVSLLEGSGRVGGLKRASVHLLAFSGS